VRRDKDKNNAKDFYTGSLNLELHPIGQGNLSLTFALFQKIYKVYNITLLKYANTPHNDSQQNKTPLADLKNHQHNLKG